MRHNRLIAAAAGVAFASTALVGCSSDDLDQAADDAKSKGSEALSDAASKDEDATDGDASGDASAGADGESGAESGAGGESGGEAAAVDLGDFADDPNAQAAAEFFSARFEATTGAGEVSAVEPVATPARYQGVQKWVEAHQGQTGPFTVTVVGVEGQDVDVCIGENGDVPATVTLVDGKVGPHVAGDHTC